MRKRLLADLDGPVVNILDRMIEEGNKLSGLNVKRAYIRTYWVSDAYGMPREFSYEILDRIDHSELLPVEGAVETLRRLKIEGYHIHFVTSRNGEKVEDERQEDG